MHNNSYYHQQDCYKYCYPAYNCCIPNWYPNYTPCYMPVNDDWKWHSMLLMHDKVTKSNEDNGNAIIQPEMPEENVVLVVEQVPKPSKSKEHNNIVEKKPKGKSELTDLEQPVDSAKNNDCYMKLVECLNGTDRSTLQTNENKLPEKPILNNLEITKSRSKSHSLVWQEKNKPCPNICKTHINHLSIESPLNDLPTKAFFDTDDIEITKECPCTNVKKSEYCEFMGRRFTYPSSTCSAYKCTEIEPLQVNDRLAYPSLARCTIEDLDSESEGVL